MAYLKHKTNGNKRAAIRKTEKPEQPVKVVVTGPDVPSYEPSPSLQHDINHVAGMDAIEASLDWIAKGIAKLTDDDNVVGLHLAQGANVYPVKVTFANNDHDDTMDRLVTALERMADCVAKLAGLSRPRLEMWHEQEAYIPRYRDGSPNGEAPAPKEQQS
jgi:hypothetical protein